MSQSKSKYSKRKRRQNPSWVPLLAGLGGLALIGIAFFMLSQRSTPKVPLEVSGSPSLKADKEKVDLGDVALGKTVEVSFQLTNVGDQTLRFTKPPFVEVVEGC